MAVEAALVTPVFILIVFGILEFGLFFKDYLAVASSVRASARIASAEPRVATYASDAVANVAKEASTLTMANVKELWVYLPKADGSPVGDTAGNYSTCTTCVKFKWDGTKFVVLSDTWPSTSQNACLGDTGRQDVGVYLSYQHLSATKFAFQKITVGEHAVMSFEPIPTGRGCKP